MKTMFHEWAANDGRLSFCAPTLREPPAPKRPRALSSNSAHPYAPSVPSKASSKRAQPVVGVQFGEVFGKTAPATREVVVTKVSGVKVTGLFERFMRV